MRRAFAILFTLLVTFLWVGNATAIPTTVQANYWGMDGYNYSNVITNGGDNRFDIPKATIYIGVIQPQSAQKVTVSEINRTINPLISIDWINLLDEYQTFSHWKIIRKDIPAAPVPEPATIFLFGVGLVGLAGAVRKKCFRNLFYK